MVTAAEKTSAAFDAAELQAVEKAIKTNYALLQPLLPDGIAMPAPDKVTDEDIATISKEVIGSPDGTYTPRAQAIRDFLKAHKPDDYDMLEHAGAIRSAAVKAVDDNTGFLGASLINIITGFFTWLSNGCQDGLMDTIKKVTVTSTENDFAQGLADAHVDPNSEMGKKAISQFNENVEIEAGLRPAKTEPPFNLANVQMIGGTPATPAAPAAVQTGQAQAPQTGNTVNSNTGDPITAHFQAVSDALNQQLGAIVPDAYKPMFASAREKLVQAGSSLTKEAIAGGKPLPSNYAIIQKAFLDVQAAESNKVVDAVVAELAKNNGENLQSVTAALKASTDKDIAMAGPLLLSQLDRNMTATQAELLALSQGKTPDKPNEPTAEQRAAAAQQSHDMLVNTLKQQVAASMPHLDAEALQKSIDETITKKTTERFGTTVSGWLNSDMIKQYGGQLGIIPSEGDRAKLAQFMTGVPDIVQRVIDDAIDNNPKSMNAKEIVDQSLAKFDAAFREATDNRNLPEVWKAYRKDIETGLKDQLNKEMDASIVQLAKILKAAPEATVAGGAVLADATPNGSYMAMSTPGSRPGYSPTPPH